MESELILTEFIQYDEFTFTDPKMLRSWSNMTSWQ